MLFFIDTAEVNEIKKVHEWGVLSGVTTNPSLIRSSGRDFVEVIKEIADLVEGPISAEVTVEDRKGMIEQGREIAKWSEHIVIKLPITADGLAACRQLSTDGIATNLTLCFSATQALLAARAGATYVSPFIGRLDDIGQSGLGLIEEIKKCYVAGQVKTKILAASIRHPQHVIQAAMLGADVATIPYKVFAQMLSHPLTDAGLKKFAQDWQAAQTAQQQQTVEPQASEPHALEPQA